MAPASSRCPPACMAAAAVVAVGMVTVATWLAEGAVPLPLVPHLRVPPPPAPPVGTGTPPPPPPVCTSPSNAPERPTVVVAAEDDGTEAQSVTAAQLAASVPSFGDTPDDVAQCRYLCARIVQHAAALFAPPAAAAGGADAGAGADAPPASFEALAARLVDQRPARCGDYAHVLNAAAAARCACDAGGDAYRAAAPAGLSVGSPALWDWLHDATVYHDFMVEWLRVTVAASTAAAPPPPPFPTASLRRPECARQLPPRPRVLLSRCPLGGGSADKMKGLLLAALLSLLHPSPRAVIVICNVVRDLRDAWLPHPRAAGFALQWSLPPWLDDLLQRVPDTWPAAAAALRRDAVAWENSVAPYEAGVAAFWNDDVDMLTITANLLLGRSFQTPTARAALTRAYAALPPQCGLPPELWALVYGAGDSVPLDVPLPPPPPPLHAAAGGAVRMPPLARAALVASGCAATQYAPPPAAVAMRPGWAAPGTNVAFQLLPWLFAASPPLQRRIAEVAAVYGADRDGTAVVAVHFRVGTPEPGAVYRDPARDPPDAAAAGGHVCGAQALRGLAALHGTPRRVLFFVAADNRDATARFAAAVHGSLLHGVPAIVVALNATTRTLHTGNTAAGAMPDDEAAAAFITLHAEVMLLSMAHAMVRSRSGFSEMAAAAGRLPLVYQLDVAHRLSAHTLCLDLSSLSAQSPSVSGTHTANVDAGLFDLPQFAVG